ncbi:uncharacterized protein PG986_001211 [Apiospora aurea]|uniref:FAD-binding domain-containing protein n=1 Tax=Apiospora aurea TaxID=335848 RepID=A0ABR1QWB1_9PEZI
MSPLKVIIVGGGLSGACLANGILNRADDDGASPIDVTIYERGTEASSRGGYQIRLGAHALVGLRACLTERQYADCLRDLPRPLIQQGTIYTASSNAKMFAAAYLPDELRPSVGSTTAKGGLSNAEKPSDYDEDQASLFVAMAWVDGPSAVEASKVKDKKSLMRKMLQASGFHPDYLKLVDALDPQEIMAAPWRQSKADTPVDWRHSLLAASKTQSDPRIAHPWVWLLGDSMHAMLPYRGMGANQAIHDTADALGPLLELARKKNADGRVTDEEVRRQVAVYANAMIPRAFEWVRKSAAQGLPDLESFKGKIIIACVRVVLHVVGGFMGVLKMFGWKSTDDAPELP